MKERTALRVAVAAAVASLLTVGLLGYRLLNHASPESAGRPPGLISAQTLTPEEAKVAVDAIFALNLPDLGGRSQPVAQWRGKVLVVNYWASWCKPCVEEMPALSRMQRQFAALGVQFVGIGVDDAGKLAAFVAATPVSYPVLVASPADTPPGLQVKALPFTVVIGRDGGIEMTRLGRIDEESLEPVLRRLVGR